MQGAAPIDPATLQAVLAPSVAGSRTLPAEAYTSQAVFDWEREHLFDRGWVCVGRIGAMAHGSIAGLGAGRDALVVTRDASGTVRAFHNTCRHRGHELVKAGELRSARTVSCRYHAWTYGLDGRLMSAPRFGDMEGFDAADHPLVGVRVEPWHGWLFANFSGDAPPLAECMGSLGPLAAAWEPERLFVGATHEYVVQANWKTLTENFHECHHCPSIHPQLSAVTALESGGNEPQDGYWIGGPMRLKEGAQTMSMTGASKGVRVRGLAEEQARLVYYYGVFPNLLLSLHPDYVMTHRVEPLGPGETRVECAWLFPPEARERPGFDPGYAAEFWDLTNRQDWEACEAVARGLRSRGFRQGPLTWKEDGVHAFMAMVARAYVEGVVRQPARIAERQP